MFARTPSAFRTVCRVRSFSTGIQRADDSWAPNAAGRWGIDMQGMVFSPNPNVTALDDQTLLLARAFDAARWQCHKADLHFVGLPVRAYAAEQVIPAFERAADACHAYATSTGHQRDVARQAYEAAYREVAGLAEPVIASGLDLSRQAQHSERRLTRNRGILNERDIAPVAGRLPGHAHD